MIVRESVEGLNEKLAFFLLDVNVADRAKRNPTAGVEGVDHPFGRGALSQLGLQHPEHIGGDPFQFELRRIPQAPFALKFFHVFATQIHLDQFALLRQGLLERADDFRHRRATAARKRDDVTVAGDVDASAIVTSSNQTRPMVGEKLRMDRSAKNAQRMFRYGGADRKHDSLVLAGG